MLNISYSPKKIQYIFFLILSTSRVTHTLIFFFLKESNHKLLEELVQKPKSINKLTFSDSDFKFSFANKEGK